MGHQLGVMIVALSLFACAGKDKDDAVALDWQRTCQQQGAALGTDGFHACVATLIEERCTEAGLEPGTDTYDQCVQAYRRTVFVAHQLELRGYELFNETN